MSSEQAKRAATLSQAIADLGQGTPERERGVIIPLRTENAYYGIRRESTPGTQSVADLIQSMTSAARTGDRLMYSDLPPATVRGIEGPHLYEVTYNLEARPKETIAISLAAMHRLLTIGYVQLLRTAVQEYTFVRLRVIISFPRDLFVPSQRMASEALTQSKVLQVQHRATGTYYLVISGGRGDGEEIIEGPPEVLPPKQPR